MPTTYPLNDSASGVLTTVNDWLKDPLAIPQAVIQMTDQSFLAEAMLRYGGRTDSGLVKYYETDPAYLNDQPRLREEFDEPHIMRSELGAPKNVSVEEIAGSILVSEEMRRRMVIDPMLTQVRKAVNTFRRAWDQYVLDIVFGHDGIQTYAVTNPWDATTATTRADIFAAKRLIKSAHPEGQDDTSRFGYTPNLLVIGEDAEEGLMNSATFNEVYHGNVASEDLRYTGKLPNQLFGLDIVVNPYIPAGKAIMMERNTAGAYVDEVPFVVEPTHEWTDHYAWRTNMRRASACFLDAPKSVCVLNGVTGTETP